MDENLESSSTNTYQTPFPVAGTSKTSNTGLTLVLPPLSALKLQNIASKTKRKTSSRAQSLVDGINDVKKPPRPVKLKPLKEVLSKLITQIKKKDDYAFFLSPVDPSKVPGYLDVVKRPMDLGTMTAKVTRGRYRSLEEFTSDVRLVTGNAKLFNPPGSIYHAEADRIEAWALDHIAKAAPTVIEYETDWNIEIEQDFDDALDGQILHLDEDDEHHPQYHHQFGTPIDHERSASVSSTQVHPTSNRRGGRGSYYRKASNSNPISETLDPDGRLPGHKDGLGVFPARSNWADLMLALKLKGKRYRTKKERMRIEKGGPPYCADGSLDYTEMEDPFSLLSFFVPDPPSRPHLTPLYPTDSSQISLPTRTTLPPDTNSATTNLSTTGTKLARGKRRHWTVTRNASTRAKIKDRDEDDHSITIQVPREAEATDWGVLATLPGTLRAEMAARGQKGVGEAEDEDEAERRVREAIRESLRPDITDDGSEVGYWTPARTRDAESFVQDVVYGGVDGFAYVRSLAEFVNPVGRDNSASDQYSCSSLGVPLAEWVEQHVVDPLTSGRHAVLRETAHLLATSPLPTLSTMSNTSSPSPSSGSAAIRDQILLSLYKYPTATAQLASLRQIMTHQIDMGALIRMPEELFGSEEVWAGREWKRRRMEMIRSESSGAGAGTGASGEVEADASKGQETDERSERESIGTGKEENGMGYEGTDMLMHVLEYSAGIIGDLDHRLRVGPTLDNGGTTDLPRFEGVPLKRKFEEEEAEEEEEEEEEEDEKERKAVGRKEGSATSTKDDEIEEDPVLRKLRLNLLALAKRAPLDKIARLPADLVPEHIRLYVPTLGS